MPMFIFWELITLPPVWRLRRRRGTQLYGLAPIVASRISLRHGSLITVISITKPPSTEVDIARRRLPNDASVFALPAYIARRQGHWEQCVRNLERAVELDPRNVWLLTDIAQTNQPLRRFPEAAAAWDRVLAVAPGDPSTRVWRALVDLDSRADTQPAYEAIQNVVRNDPSAVDAIAEQWLYLALCRRDVAEISSALASLPPEGIIRLQRANASLVL